MGSQRKIDQIPFKKVLGNSQLTQNELYTLLVRIEACLNSGPLTPLTSDPNDLEVLTPFHFLIGETHTTFPEQDWSEAPTTLQCLLCGEIKKKHPIFMSRESTLSTKEKILL
jgi:hypothetical protein